MLMCGSSVHNEPFNTVHMFCANEYILLHTARNKFYFTYLLTCNVNRLFIGADSLGVSRLELIK